MRTEPITDEGFEVSMQSADWRNRANAWAAKNPPPKTWRGTRLEWAYLNMPALPWWLQRLINRVKGTPHG